jgi:peptidylprolyl isomerase
MVRLHHQRAKVAGAGRQQPIERRKLAGAVAPRAAGESLVYERVEVSGVWRVHRRRVEPKRLAVKVAATKPAADRGCGSALGALGRRPMKPAFLTVSAALFAVGLLCATSTRAAKPAPVAPSIAPPSAADWRTPDPRNVVVIDTNKGRIIIEMEPRVAPKTVAQIRDLVREKFYDGRAFFRVLPNFMDQTGDPTDTGTGGSSKPDLPAEFTFRRGADTPMVVIYKADAQEQGFVGGMPVFSQTLDLAALTADNRVAAYGAFCPGVAGIARSDSPDSGNSQFFLMRATTPALDQKYTPWARVIAGMDVVNAIKTGEPVPPPQDKMTTVRLLADIPAAERPKIRVIDPAGPWFKAAAAREAAQKVVGASICDLDIPSEVK